MLKKVAEEFFSPKKGSSCRMCNKEKVLSFIYPAVVIDSDCFCPDAPDVTGKITDKESGEPLPGVSIRIIGTGQATTTDDDKGNSGWRMCHPMQLLPLVLCGFWFANFEGGW